MCKIQSVLKNAHVYQCIVVPLTFALLLLFISAPAALATSHSSGLSLVGPKQHYLALGDSLAFGYQPKLNYSHGYVDDFFSNLKSHGVKDVANMGCPGETSVTFLNICPNSVPITETVNAHLAADVSNYGTIVDVFSAFGGPKTPNPHICTYTWMCIIFKDIHATNTGYRVIAATFEQGTGY